MTPRPHRASKDRSVLLPVFRPVLLPVFRSVLLPLFMLALTPVAAPAAPGGPPLPAPSGFVTDKADVIDDEREAQMVALLGELERRTGAAVAVLTVQSTQPLDDQEYAERVLDLWRIGKGGGQRGALVLVAVRDRRVRILPGPVLRRILPEDKIEAIINERIVPAFKEGQYGLGILSGVWAIAEEVAIDSRIKLAFEPPVLGDDAPRKSPIALFGKVLGVMVAGLVVGLLWFVWQDYRRQGEIRTRGGPGGPGPGGEGPFRGGRGGGFGGAGRRGPPWTG